MSYFLFLDDFRSIDMVRFPAEYDFLPKIHVKNYKEFVETIQNRGLPSVVSYDHDLKNEHYSEYGEAIKRGYINYSKFKEKTGLDCAKFLINYCEENKKPLPIYFCHSMNHIGKKNILDLLKAAENTIKI